MISNDNKSCIINVNICGYTYDIRRMWYSCTYRYTYTLIHICLYRYVCGCVYGCVCGGVCI